VKGGCILLGDLWALEPHFDGIKGVSDSQTHYPYFICNQVSPDLVDEMKNLPAAVPAMKSTVGSSSTERKKETAISGT
jgi:hypothetical protein